jgi:hypothetical protein
MKITFYQRESAVYCRVSHRKDMIRQSTGIKIPVGERFSDTKERFLGDSMLAQSLNHLLIEYRKRIEDSYLKTGLIATVRDVSIKPKPEEEQTFDLYWLGCQYVEGIIKGTIKTRRKARFTLSSTVMYNYAVDRYGMFTKKIGIKLNQFDLSGKDLQEKKMLDNAFKKHFDSFVEYMIDEKLSINSRHGVMRILTAILNHFAENLFLHLPKLDTQPKFDVAIIVLPDDFVSDFVCDKHNKYESLTPDLQYVWELCAMMLVTTLRIGDAQSLKPNNFTVINDEAFLIKENQKTGADTLFPLAPRLARLVAKHIQQWGRVYSGRVKHNKMLRLMPELFRLYPEMEQVVSYKDVDVNGNSIMKSAPLSELVHPHMMRKSAITSMLGNGVDEGFVKFASGHSPNSSAFEKYKGFADRIYNEQIKNYQRKQFGE